MYFTDNPVEFGTWTLDQIGEENYQHLLDKRRVNSKVDWAAESKRLDTVARERDLI